MAYIEILDINMLGQGESFFHKLNPISKFLFLILNYIIIFNLNIKGLFIYTIFLMFLLMYSSFGIKNLLKILLFILIPMSSFIFIVVILNFDNKIQTIFIIFFKILAMIIPILFYSFTTPLRQTNYLLYIIFKPLEKLKINTNLINLTLSLVISYIPIMLKEFDNVFLIKASKGEDIKSANILKKIKIIFDSLFIILINSFLKAENLVDSILIRGFEIKEIRGFYINYKVKKKDYIFFLIILLELILFLKIK